MGFPESALEGSGENIDSGSKIYIKRGTDNVTFVWVPKYSHGSRG